MNKFIKSILLMLALTFKVAFCLPNEIEHLLESVTLSRALYVAADFGIADLLEKGPKTVQELSKTLSVDTDALQRLMYFLELNDVFSRDEQERYALTELSEKMCESNAQSIKLFLLHDDPTRWNAIGNLKCSIQTGKDAFSQLYDKDYFSYLKEAPVLSDRFNRAMKIISEKEDSLISKAFDFKGLVADIGGGRGQLLEEIKKDHGDCSVLLFDLPEAVEGVDLPKIAGSFFEPIEVKADTYILKRILHDWDDQKALIILKNLAKTMAKESQLLIFDGILDKVKNKKFLAAVDLLLLTIFNGKERFLSDFENLLAHAGLKLIEHRAITSSMSVLVCQLS